VRCKTKVRIKSWENRRGYMGGVYFYDTKHIMINMFDLTSSMSMLY